jgi:TrmH family RNA methyltransferase
MSPDTLRLELLRLQRRGQRDRSGLHSLEGVAPFLHACWTHVRFKAILFSRVLLRSSLAQKLVREKKREGVPTIHVSPEVFRSASCTARASGVAAIVYQRWERLTDVDPHEGLCWIALERIRSPGNLGTILRTAEAVGAAGLILLGDAVDPFDLRVVRSSMGAVFHLQMVRTSHQRLSAWAKTEDVHLVGSSPKTNTNYTTLAPRPPTVLLLGEEREGLSNQALALCGDVVRLPILGTGDSLNVAVAAGILLYDVLRQSVHPR